MFKRVEISLLGSVILSLNMPAFSQEAPTAMPTATLETITVSAVRQPYIGDFTALESPRTFSLISDEQLQSQNITKLSDALDLDASVARQNNFGGLWDAYAIRGFAGDENLPTGYLVNGYNAGRGFGGNRDAVSIQKIEVLKGANGALFGRSEAGGVVNIVTKKADLSGTFGELVLSAGEYDRYRAETDVNLLLQPDLALRLNGFLEDNKAERDHVENKRFGLYPSMTAELNENLLLNYELEHSKQRQPFDRGTVARQGKLGGLSPKVFLGEPSDGDVTAIATGHQLQFEYTLNPDWKILIGGSHRDTDLKGISTEPELAKSRQAFLLSGGDKISRQRRDRDYESSNQVLRTELSGLFRLADMEHRILTGVDYDRFENKQVFKRFRPPVISVTTTDLASNNISLSNPVYGAYPAKIMTTFNDRLDTHQAVGFYLQDQIALTPKLQLRLGTRFDQFKLDIDNRLTAKNTGSKDRKWSSQAGLSYQIIPTVSIFSHYGDTFRANIGADAQGVIFKPEESTSAELGAKWYSTNSKLSSTLSIFNMNKTNVLVADPLNSGFSSAVGKVKSSGVEVDVNAKLEQGIQIHASYAYTDTAVDSNDLDPNFSLPLKKGDRLINIPKHQANIQVSRNIPIQQLQLNIGAGLQYVDKRLGETGTDFYLPAYTLLNLNAQAKLTKNIDVFAHVKNVLDKQYYPGSYSSLWVQTGDPRLVTLGAKFSF